MFAERAIVDAVLAAARRAFGGDAPAEELGVRVPLERGAAGGVAQGCGARLELRRVKRVDAAQARGEGCPRLPKGSRRAPRVISVAPLSKVGAEGAQRAPGGLQRAPRVLPESFERDVFKGLRLESCILLKVCGVPMPETYIFRKVFETLDLEK